MLLQEKVYTINAEHLQDLIMDDLYFMHYYFNDYAQSEGIYKEIAYSNYKRNRALLRRMLNVQGLSDKESLMVRQYLWDLKEVILNGTYKVR